MYGRTINSYTISAGGSHRLGCQKQPKMILSILLINILIFITYNKEGIYATKKSRTKSRVKA